VRKTINKTQKDKYYFLFFSKKLLSKSYPYFLLLPAGVFLAALAIYPLFYSGYVSFHERDLIQSSFVGLNNYVRLFVADRTFWKATQNTLIYTLIVVSLEFGLGLVVALALDEITKGKNILRTVVIVPMMMTPVAVALMWRLMWHDTSGIMNYFLDFLHIQPIRWLSKPYPAFAAIVITEVWEYTSFVVLILFAGLQSLPLSPYEAAAIDGASSWQTFSHITFPLLRPAIFVALLFRTIFVLRVFDTIYVLTGGGPADATTTLCLYSYKLAFRFFDFGFACATSWMMLVTTAIIGFVIIKFLSPRGT